jgi:NAD(P)-dependent dehydrogenase (short-subunit alcohol dehydrogenase family)
VKTVLVTGAGAGIGLAIARAMREAGWQVWAGVRKPAHHEALAALGAWPLALDVRDPTQVRDAAVAVGGRLDALVHNAGVGGIGPLAGWPDRDLQDLFDTNVFGPHRLSNALLPALLAARGRIVCIGSQGGSLTAPGMGPYTMSKHALEAYAQCLRLELAPQGVAVCIVQPGAVATDIGAKGLAQNLARLDATPAPLDTMARAMARALRAPTEPDPAAPESASNRRHAPPSAVAAVVRGLLEGPEPALRHLVGTRWEGDRVITTLLERLVDAALSPSHGLAEAELQQLLHRAWAARAGGAAPPGLSRHDETITQTGGTRPNTTCPTESGEK